MKDFTVSIFPARNKTFLVSYIHPLSKRRIREHFNTKDEASEYKHQTESKFRRTKSENFLELNVEELLVIFKQEKPNAQFNKSKSYIIDFVDTFGDYKVEDLNGDVLKAWLDQIKQENNLKDISVRSLKCSIDIFFKFLVSKEVISESPLATVYYKRPDPPDLKARNLLSKKEIEELLLKAKAFSPGYLYPILKIFAETAAKPNEIIDLNWKQIDLEKKEVQFLKSESIQARTIKISDELASVLEKNRKMTGLVFLTYYKEPFTKNKFRRLVQEFKVKSSCKTAWTPMDLRHSFAVSYLQAGGDIRKLQHILGHNNVFDTKRLYAEALTTKSTVDTLSPFEIGS